MLLLFLQKQNVVNAQITTNSLWTWMKGADTTGQNSNYGIKGIASDNNSPGARVGALNWKDKDGNLWLFGGLTSFLTSTDSTANDLWKYSPITNKWVWVSGDSTINQPGVFGTKGIPDPANKPSPRFNSFTWTAADGNLWLYGGEVGLDNNQFYLLDDLWKYDPINNMWTWVQGHNQYPTTDGYYADYGTKGVFSSSNHPGSASRGVAWSDNKGNLWMFSGAGYTESCLGEPIDIWEYTPHTNQWAWIRGDKSCNSLGYGVQGVASPLNSPSSREYAVSWKDLSGNLYLFGGIHNSSLATPNNQMWKYDINSNEWLWLNVSGTLPKPRVQAAACTDEEGNMWLSGGAQTWGSSPCLQDIWRFDPINSTWIWTKGSTGLTYSSGNYGTQGVSSTSNEMGVRCNHSMWADNSGNLWIFGGMNWGWDNRLMNDLWKLSTIIGVEINNANCINNYGSFVVSASYGIEPYQYSIDGLNFQSSNTFSGLSAGTYTITVKDAIGDIRTRTATIAFDAPPTLTANSNASTCGLNNGSITAVATGGTAPFLYSLNGSTYQTGNLFTALTPGNYTVYVKDGNGCVSTATAVIGDQPGPTMSSNSTSSTCNNNNGSITATASGGTAPLQFSITGTTYQSSNVFNALSAGNYTVYVKDANGCTATSTVTINSQPSPTLTANSSSSTCSTNNGSITANATGGTPPLQYSINGTAYQSSNIFTNLASGNYPVYVKDANDCITTITATIADESSPTVTAASNAATCANNDGSITITATGGKTPLQYSINSTTYQSGNVFTGLAAGNYTVSVKDANNCISTYPITVSSLAIPPIAEISIYPNPISNNQFTIVLGNQLQGSYSIRILDMTGKMVYKTIISNTCTCCTGSYSIKLPRLLSSGVYNIEIIDPKNNKNMQRLLVSVTN